MMFVCERKTLRDLSVGLTQLCSCGSLCWIMSGVTQVQYLFIAIIINSLVWSRFESGIESNNE